MKAEQSATVRLDGHTVKITRPEKVLFPDDGITKGDLIRYYERIGPWMLPYLQDRPLSLQRYPDGIQRPAFFQKSVSAYYPGWIKKATVQKAGGTVTHAVCNDVATLVYLANQACITLHVWLSRYNKAHFPDQMIFDLDPPGKVTEAVNAAFALKKILDDLKLPAFVKSTGSRGLHVTVPLQPKEDFDAVRAFGRQIGDMLVSQDPARYTMEQYKNKRGARVFIDTNRNAYAQTAVATYSVRARAGAPVSVPLAWDELEAKNFRADGVTIQTVFDRLDRIRDPWKEFGRRATSLEKARRKLD
jgi:bifunctional non-homologous end joining protein LigD